LALVQTKFGPIPRPTRVLTPTYTREPTQDGERSVTVRRVGDVQAVCAVYHVPAGSHPEYAAVAVLARILGDTPSGRLHKALVETRKASSVSASDYQLREPGTIQFLARVRKEGSLEEARDVLLRTVEGVAAAPPTREEVDRARSQLLKQITLGLNASDRVGLELSEWIGMGDWRLYFLHRDRLRGVTPADVQRVAAAYLKPTNRTVGLFIPTPMIASGAAQDRAEIPPVPDVAQMVREYTGSQGVAMGEAFDPSPANIEARITRRDTTGGVKLALLPKKTRGGAVFAALALHIGSEKSLEGRATAASLAGQMLMRGTTRRTRQQIQDEFDRLQARAMVMGSATGVRVSVETTRENLPEVLRLVAEILRSPAFPADEFAQLKEERLAAVEAQKSEPGRVASNALQRHLNPYPKDDVRYVETPEEEIASIRATTLEDVRRFHADFYGAGSSELAVVGDFDDAQIAKLAGELFGSWKSRRPYARVPDLYHDVSPINPSFETPDKANAVFMAGLPLPLRDDDPDYAALVLGNTMLGGGFLNSRLATRIRQKEGLSYGISSSLFADSLDRSGLFTARAISAPENASRVETAFKEEIARALKDGFSAEEVAAAKSGTLRSRQVGRAQDRMLAIQLATHRFLGRTFAWDADLETRIQALTPEEILAALRKHLNPSRITIIKAGDFARTAARAGTATPASEGTGR
jgi:zinc protease